METHSSCSGQSGIQAATTSASGPSPSLYFSARIQSLSERWKDFDSELEFEVESLKSHWTEPSVAISNCDSEEEQLPNSVVFEILKEHHEWGPLFRRWPDKLEIGEKIAKGGQAEIFAASRSDAIFASLSSNERSRWPRNRDVVVKVFKDGFPLQDLQKLWPPGLASASLRHEISPWLLFHSGLCCALCVQLLEDGRFAFIYEKMWGDLHKHIDGRMLKSNGPPLFTLQATCRILRSIAMGMDRLHRSGVLHRGLKAANILIRHAREINWVYVCPAIIADFESHVGL